MHNELFRIKTAQYKPGRYMAPHFHAFGSISLVLRGDLFENVSGCSLPGSAASIVVKPPGVVHEDFFGENGASLFSIEVSDLNLLNKDGRRLFDSWKWLRYSNASLDALRMFIEVAREKQLSRQVALLNGFFSRIDRLAGNCDRAPGWVQDVKSDIERNFCDPFFVKELAADYGVHPVYLARVFRKYYGCSVKEYVKTLRLHDVAGLLVQPGQLITPVAYESGFSDQSHMHRILRDELNIRPGELQKLAVLSCRY